MIPAVTMSGKVDDTCFLYVALTAVLVEQRSVREPRWHKNTRETGPQWDEQRPVHSKPEILDAG